MTGGFKLAGGDRRQLDPVQRIASAGAADQQSRFAAMDNPANVAAAGAEFKQDPQVRLLMDNGAAINGDPGAIGARGRPISATGRSALQTDQLLPSGKNGALSASKVEDRFFQSSYLSDPSARPAKDRSANAQGDSGWPSRPYNWAPVADSHSLSAS